MPDSPIQRPTRFRWVVFSLACGTSWLLYLHRYVFGLIKADVKEEFGLTNTELGLLDSTFAFAYSFFQIPFGIATDAFGVHFMLTGMIVLWCVGLGLHASATGLVGLRSGRFLLGFGQAGVFAALSQVTRTWFPSSVRTTVQGWVGVFMGRSGGFTTFVLIGSVVLGVWAVKWQNAVYVLTAIGLVHAVVFFVLYRNTPSDHPLVNAAEADLIAEISPPAGLGESSQGRFPKRCAMCGHVQSQVAEACEMCGEAFATETSTSTASESGAATSSNPLTIRQMLAGMSPRSLLNLGCLNVQSILSTIADNIFSAWIPLFLSDVHGLNYKEMGLLSALPLLGGACGGALGGWLNDLLIRTTGSRRWARSLVGMTGKGIAGVLLLADLFLWYDDPYTFCYVLVLVKFFSDWSLTTGWGVITDIGGRSTATVFAFNNAVASFFGAMLAPIMYGIMADDDWQWVFITGAVAYLACAASWLAIDCRIPVIDESRSDSHD
ncbi:MAG: MFS transporter [Planctomycetota bacterium]|nr:MFS transporter [Planctomycetota bacterium]